MMGVKVGIGLAGDKAEMGGGGARGMVNGKWLMVDD
jgi:hypothetical protein